MILILLLICEEENKIWEETEITTILRVTHYKQLIRNP